MNKWGDDEDFRFAEGTPPAVRSMVNHWATTVPGKEGVQWTKTEIANHLILGGNGAKIVGSAKTVAAELQKWVDEADVDGFNFSYATVPGKTLFLSWSIQKLFLSSYFIPK